jgi:hypothetical protein
MINYNYVNKEMEPETVTHVQLIIHLTYSWASI